MNLEVKGDGKGLLIQCDAKNRVVDIVNTSTHEHRQIKLVYASLGAFNDGDIKFFKKALKNQDEDTRTSRRKERDFLNAYGSMESLVKTNFPDNYRELFPNSIARN